MSPTDSHSTATFGRRYFIFLIIFLGMLSAFGPFVTDMYLPTLPSMSEIFHTSPSMVQMGLAASMLGLAVGQIFFGPLSDKYGRKSVLMSAMVLFAVSTIGCIFSTDIEVFNICRFLQGLGGSGGIVLSRSVATDCYSGRELAKMLAIIGAVNGIAPVTAPVIGGLVSESVGWKGIFWILLGIGIIILLLCIIFKESLPADRRHKGSVMSLMSGFPKLFRMKYYIVYVLLYGFGCGILFSYISSASFIIQNYFGFSQLGFSLIFGVNALGIGIGSALSLKFRKMTNAALFGAAGVATAATIQLISHLLLDTFIPYEITTFLMLVCVGYIFTAATTLAMDEGRAMVGTASALFGATGFLFGGIVSPLVSIGNIMTTTVCMILGCAIAALTFAVISALRKKGVSA